jgi:hypothetical protein
MHWAISDIPYQLFLKLASSVYTIAESQAAVFYVKTTIRLLSPSGILLPEMPCSQLLKMDLHHLVQCTARRIYFVQDPGTYSR